MRLTAVRQSPKDVSGPMNPRQMKRKSIPNDLYSPHLCFCKHTSSELENLWRARQYDTPQGGAVQAPHSNDLSNPLHVLTTRNSGTRRDHMSLNLAPNKKFP